MPTKTILFLVGLALIPVGIVCVVLVGEYGGVTDSIIDQITN